MGTKMDKEQLFNAAHYRGYFSQSIVSVHQALQNFRSGKYVIGDWESKVWNEELKRDLIESIIMGIQLPHFWFYGDYDPYDPKIYEQKDQLFVLDGIQRFKAIIGFVNNDFSLSNDLPPEFKNKYYQDLPLIYKSDIVGVRLNLNIVKGAPNDLIELIRHRANL